MEEELYDIPDFEGYQATKSGKIWSKKSNKFLQGGIDEKGYLRYCLQTKEGQKSVRGHQLIALTFIPNPNNYLQVNHKDENKKNNNVDNLEWCDNNYNYHYGNHIFNVAESNKKKIWKCDKTTHEKIQMYDSMKEASIDNNIKSYSQIGKVCRNEAKSAGGFWWCFDDEKDLTKSLTKEKKENIINISKSKGDIINE